MKILFKYLILGCITAILATAATLPQREKREMADDDHQKCMDTCPQDVGCTINDKGNAVCHYISACESGLGHCPPPTPHSHNRKRRSEMTQEQVNYCMNHCLDVGCVVNNEGKAECDYNISVFDVPTPIPPNHE